MEDEGRAGKRDDLAVADFIVHPHTSSCFCFADISVFCPFASISITICPLFTHMILRESNSQVFQISDTQISKWSVPCTTHTLIRCMSSQQNRCRVFTQVLAIFSTNHGNMGLFGQSVFNLSLCCQSCTVLTQAVPSLRNSEDKTSTALSWLLGGGGGGDGGIFVSYKQHSFFCHRSKLRTSHIPKSFCLPPHSSTDRGLTPPWRKSEEQQEKGSKLSRRNIPWQCTSSLQLSECRVLRSTSSHPCTEQKETKSKQIGAFSCDCGCASYLNRGLEPRLGKHFKSPFV